ncbi:hypothetical protein GCM10027343_14620 [Noviherbaspirillum agri]
MKIRFSADPAVAHEVNGLAVRYAASKREIANWRWRILVLFVLAPLLIFLSRLIYGAVWADMPGFVAMDETVLKAPVAGRVVSTIPVGRRVREGDVIAELRNEVLEQEYNFLLESQRAKAAPAPNDAESRGVGGRGITNLNAAVTEARELFSLRKQQYERMSELAGQGAATQTEVAQAYADMAAAQRNLRTAQNDLKAVRSRSARATGSSPEVVPLVTQEPRLAEKAAMLEAMKVRATEDGIVAQVFGKHGEWIAAGAEVASLRLQRPAKIEVFVEPSWAKYATVNSWATVNFLDGYSHRARVTEVKMQAQRLPPDRANPLTVRHHSVVVLLDPLEGLPEQYRVNVLPVNVQFDRHFPIERLAFWRETREDKVASVHN